MMKLWWKHSSKGASLKKPKREKKFRWWFFCIGWPDTSHSQFNSIKCFRQWLGSTTQYYIIIKIHLASVGSDNLLELVFCAFVCAARDLYIAKLSVVVGRRNSLLSAHFPKISHWCVWIWDCSSSFFIAYFAFVRDFCFHCNQTLNCKRYFKSEKFFAQTTLYHPWGWCNLMVEKAPL